MIIVTKMLINYPEVKFFIFNLMQYAELPRFYNEGLAPLRVVMRLQIVFRKIRGSR
jgi:hypothetical protein